MKRLFINQTNDSNKFWSIEQIDNRCLIQWGKVGANARSNEKEFATANECAKEMEKLIREKTRKGYSEVSDLATIPEKPVSEYKPMDEDVFWEIIALFNWKKKDDDDVMKPALKKLVSMPEEDIYQFQEILTEKLYALDGLVYAVCSGEYDYPNGYLSPDMFLYARCVPIVNGKEYYYNVLKNPIKFPRDMDFESVLYLANDALNKKLKSEDEYIETELSYETGSNEALWNIEVSETLDKQLREISEAVKLLRNKEDCAHEMQSTEIDRLNELLATTITIRRRWRAGYYEASDYLEELYSRPRIDFRIDRYLFDFINEHILNGKKLPFVRDYFLELSPVHINHSETDYISSQYYYETEQTKYAWCSPHAPDSDMLFLRCESLLFNAEIMPTEYANIIYDMLARYFTFRHKEILTMAMFDELKQKIDYDFIHSFKFPAPFKEQKYEGDDFKIPRNLVDDPQNPFYDKKQGKRFTSLKEAYLAHFFHFRIAD